MSEDTTRERFSPDLEIHTLELRKLHLLSRSDNPKLYRWSRFLVANSDEEFEALAQEDPDMADAKHTLEEISSDPDVRARAYERETALRAHYHTIAAEREAGEAAGEVRGRVEGEANGEIRGRVEGRVEGLRNTLLRQLAKRFGDLPDWATGRVAHADAAQLESYFDELLEAQSLEDALKRNG